MWKAVTKPFMNIEKIHPQQQDAVGKMIDHCKNDENIRKIIIFGSSTREDCRPESDVDIFFDFKTEPDDYPVLTNTLTPFDNWSNFTVSRKLDYEIIRTGVTVYER